MADTASDSEINMHKSIGELGPRRDDSQHLIWADTCAELLFASPVYILHIYYLLLAGYTADWVSLMKDSGWRERTDQIFRSKAYIFCGKNIFVGGMSAKARRRSLQAV